MTVGYDPLAAGPSAFAAAISELGYEAKAPSQQQSKESALKQLSRLYVSADAPKFFADAVERARATKRPIIIDFWAEWCAACLRFKRETLEHPEAAEVFSAIELIYVDLDKYPALGEAYGVVAIPDVFLIDRSGRIVDRMQKFVPPKAFVARVRKAFGQPLNRDTGDG
ncbi:MAG: thioredoxin family protein [Planctomycetota bacterium]|nr:thioredoxin family protein [Planctomycetota bacterium]